VVAFQITFCIEIHANNIFFIFLKLFFILAHQNDSKHINHIKFKKNLNFLKRQFCKKKNNCNKFVHGREVRRFVTKMFTLNNFQNPSRQSICLKVA
jgi:hypothetical protein